MKNKTKIDWGKGGKRPPLSEEHKKSISDGVKKHPPSTTFKKGFTPWTKGKRGYTNKGSFKKGKLHPLWKGGKFKSNKYIFILQPNHPFANQQGYIREHRLIMEKHLGRYLKQSEEIHHIDGNTINNKLNNLMLFPNKSAHTIFHNNLRHRTSPP